MIGILIAGRSVEGGKPEALVECSMTKLQACFREEAVSVAERLDDEGLLRMRILAVPFVV